MSKSMNKKSKIFLCGHNGMVGSAIFNELSKNGYTNISTITHKELDLTRTDDVVSFFKSEKPDYVILCAAMVGGIYANEHHNGDFFYTNMLIELNVLKCCVDFNVKKVLLLGSSCIYPIDCERPIKEDGFGGMNLEKTNEGYALAKICGIKLGEFYHEEYGLNIISVMPCNLYGKNDNFSEKNSHAFASIVKKMVNAVDSGADSVTLFGDGMSKREFLNVIDCAKYCVFLFENYDYIPLINIGSGEEISILNLANKIKELSGFNGEILWDTTKSNGVRSKVLDVSYLKSLCDYKITSLEDGIKEMIDEYKLLKSQNNV